MDFYLEEDNFKYFEDGTTFNSDSFNSEQLKVIFNLYQHAVEKFKEYSESFVKRLNKEDFLKAIHYKTVAETLSITLCLSDSNPMFIRSFEDDLNYYQDKIANIYNTMIFNNEFINNEIEHFVR